MQIFRVSEDHKISAQFLDNRRLSKQVLEMYQIIRVCLAKMGIIEGNTRYLSHPVVKSIYNDGYPYLIDALRLLNALDDEHQRRGGKRSLEFRQDLDVLSGVIKENESLFSKENIPPFFVYGDEKLFGDSVFKRYEILLFLKWKHDKIPARCNIQKK